MTRNSSRRQFLGAIGAFVFIFLSFFHLASAQQQIGITVNGNAIDVYPQPIMQAGRVFVPLRGVFENLGATVVYSNGEINATSGSTEVSLQIGSTQASVNGSPTTIDVAPFIIGASTYVPLRFVSQALGATVDWDEADQIVAITTPQSVANNNDVTQAPPPIPYYEPPPVPAPNYIWVPGYWAWGFAGYYWVPGTWAAAPQPGLLWTPGYWGWQNQAYIWHPGYWAIHIGFYGGVNYGGGYYGNGYAGGMWQNNQFRYNTAVSRVTNTTIIKNVYIDKTVVVNNNAAHTSYSGGPGGVVARPTAPQIAAASDHHVAMTSVQQQHVQIASQDRQLLAKVNAGNPPVLAAPKPFTAAAKPAGFVPVSNTDRVVPIRPATPIRPAAPVRSAAPRPAQAPTRAAPPVQTPTQPVQAQRLRTSSPAQPMRTVPPHAQPVHTLRPVPPHAPHPQPTPHPTKTPA